MNLQRGFLYFYLFCFAVCFTFKETKAQGNAFEGKNFTVSYIIPSGFAQPNHLVLVSKVNTTATVKNPAKGINQTVSLIGGVATTITLTTVSSTPVNSEQVDTFGVEIISQDDIMVQQFAASGNGDGTMAYPHKNLGTEYVVMSFDGSSGFQAGQSSVLIVATQNNTQIEITPAKATAGNRPAGVPFIITLNKNQTYLVKGNSTNDMTGTTVKVLGSACKPIVVYGGSSCSEVPTPCTNSCGHLFEMMPRLDAWGKSFVVAPFASAPFSTPTYTYRVLASENNTTVIINGTSSVINKGEWAMANTIPSTNSTCIDANKPVLVAQYTEGFACGGAATPRMQIIPPLEQMVKSASVLGTSGFSTSNIIQIVVKTAAKVNLKLNSAIIPIGNFKTFTNCADWSYVNATVSGKGPHTITCDSGFIATMHFAQFNGYAYAAATNARVLKYDVANGSITCGNLSIQLYNTGDTANIVQSTWLFPDNTSLAGKNVTKVFPSHAQYNITNVVTYQNQNLCQYTDTIQHKLRTLPLPWVGFTINDSVQCLKGNEFIFNDTTKYIAGGKKQQTTWEFGDTAYIYQDSFLLKRVFNSAGLIKVKLTAKSNDLCVDSAIKTVNVQAQAQPIYTVQNPQCFKGHAFIPTQQSKVPGSTIVGYSWDFGDGTKSTQPVPVKMYAKDSTYTITLGIQAANGCNDTIQKTFTIFPSPTANFTTANACFNDTLKTTNLSSFSGPLTYLWRLGDGNTDTSTHIKKQYADTGTYAIKLIATTPDGCRDSITRTAKILPSPAPAFTFSKKCTYNTSSFTNQTYTWGQPGTAYTWRIDDSTQYVSTNVNHIYKKPGSYKTRLYAQMANGCKDSTSKSLYINPLPVVDFTVNDSVQCQRGNYFDFFNNTTLSEGKISSFTWKMNDTFWSNNISVNKLFDTFGINTIKLVAVTDSACADSLVKTVQITPQTTLDLVSANDTQCFKNHAFNLVNNSSVPQGNVTYYWKYSNGDIDSMPHPAPKKFSSFGTYQLTLLAVTDKGCRDSVIKKFTIYPSPQLSFDVNDVCGSDSARFLNTSKVASGRIVSWQWDLGDGNSTAVKHPVHFYNNFGYYDVGLIGITDLGCPDTIKIDSALKVRPAPKARFTSSLVEHRGNLITYDFINQSTGATRFFWNFDRGMISREENPQFIFSDTGTYHINLSVANNDDCFSTYDTVITILPEIEIFIPNAFTPNLDVNNSVFRIEGSFYYREFEMHIFDRWGQEMFSTTDPNHGWDGRYDGKLMEDGLYIYTIRMIGIDTKVRIYKGNLLLLR